jgi:glutamine synthetase
MTSLLGEDRKIETNIESVVNQVETERVPLVRFLFCDTSGIIRGKAAHVDNLVNRLQAGIGLVKGTMAQNMLDELQTDTGYGATGEVRLTPDLSTFSVLPYTAQSAAVICDLLELDRNPSNLCPRSALKRQTKAVSELGIRIQASFEPEFTLGTLDEEGRYVPIDQSICVSSDGMNRAAPFANRLVNALEKQRERRSGNQGTSL